MKNKLFVVFHDANCSIIIIESSRDCRYLRKDDLCLGSFPLNVTNFPSAKCKTFAKDLYRVISSLVPKSHYLEMTLDQLNDMNFIPKWVENKQRKKSFASFPSLTFFHTISGSFLPRKDYECNRLTSGILQLSKNTHLVIDETSLTSGQVSAMGKKNYEAISDVIKFQKLNYDFTYFSTEYETDIPVLILSEVKSFIPVRKNDVTIRNLRKFICSFVFFCHELPVLNANSAQVRRKSQKSLSFRRRGREPVPPGRGAFIKTSQLLASRATHRVRIWSGNNGRDPGRLCEAATIDEKLWSRQSSLAHGIGQANVSFPRQKFSESGLLEGNCEDGTATNGATASAPEKIRFSNTFLLHLVAKKTLS